MISCVVSGGALLHSSSSLRSRSTELHHGTRTQEDGRNLRHGEARAEGPAVPPQGGEFDR